MNGFRRKTRVLKGCHSPGWSFIKVLLYYPPPPPLSHSLSETDRKTNYDFAVARKNKYYCHHLLEVEFCAMQKEQKTSRSSRCRLRDKASDVCL